MNTTKQTAKRGAAPTLLSLVQFFYWAGTTVMVGFMVTYLKEAGYSDSESGLIASWVAAGTMLLQPAFGYVSDSLCPARRLLLICFGVGAPLALGMPLLGKGLLLSAGVIGISLLCEPQATLLDNYIMRMREVAPEVDYGRVRAWGPAGSAAAALAAGLVGKIWSLRAMFLLISAFFVAALFFLWRCEEVGCPNKRGDESRDGQKAMGFLEALRTLLHIPAYLAFIGCCALFQFAMRTATTFLGPVVAEAGGGTFELGLLLVVVYAAQTPFILWAGGRLKAGVPCEKVFLVAAALGALRLYLFTLSLPFWLMACTQLLQAAGTALYVRVFVQHITDITPQNIHATATSIGAAASLGMGQVVGGVVHGRVIENFGAGASALLSSAVMAATFALFLLAMRFFPASSKGEAAKT